MIHKMIDTATLFLKISLAGFVIFGLLIAVGLLLWGAYDSPYADWIAVVSMNLFLVSIVLTICSLIVMGACVIYEEVRREK